MDPTQLKQTLKELGLGCTARDPITNMSGTIDSIRFDVSGQVFGALNPPYNEKEGRLPVGIWVDVGRLEVTNTKPVVQVPAYEHVTPIRKAG
jgi:hypothetical protein